MLDFELVSFVIYFMVYFVFYFVFYFGWHELVVLDAEVLTSLLLLQLVGEVPRVLLLFCYNPATNFQVFKSSSL